MLTLTAKMVLLLLILSAATTSAQLLLQGPLTVSSGTGNGLQVTHLQLPSGASTETSYPVDGSNLQSSATHKFLDANSAECVVNLRNSTTVSAVIQCEDSAPYDIAYPGSSDGGCLPTSLLNGSSFGHIFYVQFSGPCIPLRVQVNTGSSPFQVRVSQEYPDHMSGKDVLVCKGGNGYEGEEAVYYTFLEGSEVVLVSSLDGLMSSISATDIGSCSTPTGLYPLPTHLIHPTMLGLIVDCTDSAGTALRYLVFYNDADQALDRVEAVSEAGGVVRVSEDGAFLAITLHRDGVYSVILYSVTNILRTPVRILYEDPVHIQFLQHGNGTVLVLFREGQNVEFVEAGIFTSSHGNQGRAEVSNTTVQSCDPSPYVGIVAEDYLMVRVWNSLSHQFDLKYTRMGSDTVTTIPQVASAPPVFLFTSGLEPVPAPVTTETHTTSQGGVTTATTEPTSKNKTAPTTFPLLSIALPIVLGALILLIAILLGVIFTCWILKRSSQMKGARTPPIQASLPFPTQVTWSGSGHSLNTTPNTPSPQMLSRHSMSGNP